MAGGAVPGLRLHADAAVALSERPFLAHTDYGLFAQRGWAGSGRAFALLVAARIGRRTTGGRARGGGQFFPFTGVDALHAHGQDVCVHEPGGDTGRLGFVVRREWSKPWLLGLLGVVGVGCRLPQAFFAVLVRRAWHEGLTWRHFGGGVMSPFPPWSPDPFTLGPETCGSDLRFSCASVPLRLWRTRRGCGGTGATVVGRVGGGARRRSFAAGCRCRARRWCPRGRGHTRAQSRDAGIYAEYAIPSCFRWPGRSQRALSRHQGLVAHGRRCARRRAAPHTSPRFPRWRWPPAARPACAPRAWLPPNVPPTISNSPRYAGVRNR